MVGPSVLVPGWVGQPDVWPANFRIAGNTPITLLDESFWVGQSLRTANESCFFSPDRFLEPFSMSTFSANGSALIWTVAMPSRPAAGEHSDLTFSVVVTGPLPYPFFLLIQLGAVQRAVSTPAA